MSRRRALAFIMAGGKAIVMDGTRLEKGARLRRVIVDRFNAVPGNTVIGEDPEEDGRRYFRDASGIVVIPRGGREHVIHLEKSL